MWLPLRGEGPDNRADNTNNNIADDPTTDRPEGAQQNSPGQGNASLASAAVALGRIPINTIKP